MSPRVPPILIKADRDGFTLVPDSAASLDAIVSGLNERFKQSRDFFQNAHMVLDLRTRPMRTDEISLLYEELCRNSQVKVIEVRVSEDLSFSLTGEVTKPRSTAKEAAGKDENNAPIIIRNTCRSGVRIVSPSDAVVLGDVNPGAEIIAAGDVVVFGVLRGLAHAGATGERGARIWALSIDPSQIRIADLLAVPPQGPRRPPNRFEVAEIENGTIRVISL